MQFFFFFSYHKMNSIHGSANPVTFVGTVQVILILSWAHQVMEAAQASTGLSGSFRGGFAFQNVNHIAHLSGALIGVALVWLLSRVPSQPPDQDVSTIRKKTDRP